MRFLVFALVGVLAACSNTSSTDKAATSAAPAKVEGKSDAHAPASVMPGSHDDWCGEHGVPESQCTRCNPKLIPAFKASGDWCAEHDLPESQCLKCNPDLKIVRPPAGS